MMNWDREIDAVARQISDGEPDAGFTERVLARIGRERTALWPRRRSAWRWSPVAVAAVAIAAVLMVRPGSRSDAVSTPSAVLVRPSQPSLSSQASVPPHIEVPRRGPATSNAGSVAMPSATATSAPTSIAAAKRSNSGPAGPSAVADAVGKAEYGRLSAAAPHISELVPPPLEITPLELEAMESAQAIPIARLAVAPLEVAALASDAQ